MVSLLFIKFLTGPTPVEEGMAVCVYMYIVCACVGMCMHACMHVCVSTSSQLICVLFSKGAIVC